MKKNQSMRRFFLFTILILGLVQAQQVQYCLESRMGAGTDTLNLYMQSTSNQVVNVAAVNFSIVFHDSCTQAPGVLLNEFENTWGNFVARRDTAYNQMASYRGVQYDTRWQYANASCKHLEAYPFEIGEPM